MRLAFMTTRRAVSIAVLFVASCCIRKPRVVSGFSVARAIPPIRYGTSQDRTRRASGAPPCSGPILSLYATSSSDLKENENADESNGAKTSKSTSSSSASKFPKDSVVSRLKQAATRAATKARIAQEEAAQKEARTTVPSIMDARVSTRLKNLDKDYSGRAFPQPKALGSLTKLTAMIDAQLSRSRQGLNHVQYQQLQPPRDSMTAVMIHNDRMDRKPLLGSTSMATQSAAPPKQVAIVLAKPLMNDQITIEYAARIQRLVRAMVDDDYRPDLLCFVQGYGRGTLNSTHTLALGSGIVSDCDVGYIYFRHLAASMSLNVTGTTFHLERQSIQSGALDAIAALIQRECVPLWIQQVAVAATAVSSSHTVERGTRRLARKLPIQFTLVSSEYHLCILNDIHVRSPGQSPLRSFERWSSVSIDGSTVGDNGGAMLSSQSIQLETSWTYLYATTANMRLASSSAVVPDDDDHLVATFAAACYKRSQDLIPVLQNLRGVVADKEFFQRDNYRVLVQARRALVSDMERLYQQQPSLAAVHRVMSPSPQSNEKNIPNDFDGQKLPLDVVLEGALLSLGRCLDLVRPAGLLTGIVPSHDFRLAVNVLEQAVSQISVACDPDQPLPPSGWGALPLLDENYVYNTDEASNDDVTYQE